MNSTIEAMSSLVQPYVFRAHLIWFGVVRLHRNPSQTTATFGFTIFDTHFSELLRAFHATCYWKARNIHSAESLQENA